MILKGCSAAATTASIVASRSLIKPLTIKIRRM
jgi:hypothetical protein